MKRLPKKPSINKLQRAIKKYCLWCCANQTKEAGSCVQPDCPLFHYIQVKTKGKLLKRIKDRCYDCSGFSREQVRFCYANDNTDVPCPLYPYRLGLQRHSTKKLHKVKKV